jgi:hypothetical protein
VEYVLGLTGNRRLDKRVRRLLGRARMQARTTWQNDSDLFPICHHAVSVVTDAAI